MRVLVVEDEVRLAATLQDLLELNGYTVDVCHDGEAGLDNALTSIYDVILLDVDGTLLNFDQAAAPPAGGGQHHAGADAHGPVRADGPGERAGLRCGLLSHQAL